jgi:hypothetical protein
LISFALVIATVAIGGLSACGAQAGAGARRRLQIGGYRTRNNAQNASVDPSDFTIDVAGDENRAP